MFNEKIIKLPLNISNFCYNDTNFSFLPVLKKLKLIIKKIIYLFNKYLLNTSFMPGTFPDPYNTTVNKSLCSHGSEILIMGEIINNKQINKIHLSQMVIGTI